MPTRQWLPSTTFLDQCDAEKVVDQKIEAISERLGPHRFFLELDTYGLTVGTIPDIQPVNGRLMVLKYHGKIILQATLIRNEWNRTCLEMWWYEDDY